VGAILVHLVIPARGGVARVAAVIPGAAFAGRLFRRWATLERAAAEHLWRTPLSALLPHLAFAAAALAALCAAHLVLRLGAHLKRWRRVFLELRMAQQAAGGGATSFTATGDLTFVFRERVSDLWRDFAVDGAARAGCVVEAAICGAVAVLLPLWQLLLPAGSGGVQLLAIAAAAALAGLLRCHAWADQVVLASLNARCEGSESGSDDDAEPAAAPSAGKRLVLALMQRPLRGVSVLAGADALTALLSLAPLHAFLATGHYCEFSGVQWTAAFVGFDDSHALRSGALVALNSFAPHVLLTLLAVLPALAAFQSSLVGMDAAAADGHRLLEPLKARGGEAFDERLAWSNTPPAPHAAPAQHSLQGFLAHAAPGGRGTAQTLVRRGLAAASDAINGFSGLLRAHLAGGCLPSGSLGQPSGGLATWFDLGATPLQWQLSALLHATVATSLLTLVAVRGAALLAATANVALQRRHLMIWAVFTPRWLFEVCFWAVTAGAAAAVALVTDYVLECSLPLRVGG